MIPGFRFRPTGVELLKYFLKRKLMGKKFDNNVIAEVDIYKYAPWDLPYKSHLQDGDLEWYFFCPVSKKHGSGSKLNRATEIGFWKATGKDRAVQHNNQTVGMIKTLVFHTGKAPRGDRTDWVIHEYRLEDKDLVDRGIVLDSYVICKVFQKEGPGPRNGAQYGRPFKEEDWSDDDHDDDEVVGLPFAESAAQVPWLAVTANSSSSVLTGLLPSPDPANHSYPYKQAVSDDDDDILSMLDIFNDCDIYPEENVAEGALLGDFFEGLEDLDCSALGSFGQNTEFSTNGMTTNTMGDVGCEL